MLLFSSSVISDYMDLYHIQGDLEREREREKSSLYDCLHLHIVLSPGYSWTAFDTHTHSEKLNSCGRSNS